MSVKVKGVQELINYYDKVGNKKVPKKALKKASKYVLEVEKDTAKNTHNKYSKKVGYNYLKSFPPRIYKDKGFVDIGLKDKDGSNWKKQKGLYYNHYGFHHNGWQNENTRKNRLKHNKKSGKFIAGSRWMDNAYDNSVDHAYELLEEGLMEGLDL